MPIQVLAINGSPRGRKSNTDQLLQPFLQGAAAAGAVCETIYATELEINECIGCFTCWKKTPGVCVFKDDMVQLLDKMRQADILVWATPVYHFGMNVRLRRIVERTLPTCQPYMVKNDDHFSHPSRFNDGPQKTVLIANCGFPDRCNFDQLVGTFDKIAGGSLAASILCGGGELFGIKELQGRFNWYTDAVFAAGHELAERGAVSRETLETLEKPLMPIDMFINFANASWEVEGEEPPTLEEALNGQTKTPQDEPEFLAEPIFPIGRNTARDLIAGMPTAFRPEAAGGLKTVIQFSVTGEEPGETFLQIAEGQCRAFAGKHPSPQLTIHTPSSVWLGIARGELDGMDAMLQGKYSAEGDMNLMIKFNSLFKSEPVPAAREDRATEVQIGPAPKETADLFRGMAEKFDPEQAPGLNAVFQFKVTGDGPPAFYHLAVEDGECEFREGTADKPSVTVTTPARVWRAIAHDELDGSTALMNGQYTYEGDLMLLMRMKAIFSKGSEAPAEPHHSSIAPGPIRIPGMQWLTVAFLPWMYFWIFSGNHRLSSLLVPLLVSLIILAYRVKFIEPTPMDIGSPIFFALMIPLYFIFPKTLFQYGPVLGTLAQGLIWAVTLITDKPLTVPYAKYNYPAGYEKNLLFITINSKITAFWVAIYIAQAVIAIAAPVSAAFRGLWMIASYFLLLPAFVFTARFPEWYIRRCGSEQG